MTAEKVRARPSIADRGEVLEAEAVPVRPVASGPGGRGLARFFRRGRGEVAERTARVNQTIEVLPSPVRATRSFPVGWLSFLVFVLLPAMAVSVYFAFIASNQYVAETRFVVRLGSPGGGGHAGGGIASVLSNVTGAGAGGGSSSENAHIVASYIHSRSILDDLVKNVDVREIFSRPEADFYARLQDGASVDDLRDYWTKMVHTSIDPFSGIVTVEVRAFRPDDAVVLVKNVLTLSERLVNVISTRAREDALRRASDEVRRAQGLLYESLQDMERFRNEEGLIDPIETAKETGKLLAKLLAEQLEVENQLFVASKSLSPDSTSVRMLQVRADNLRKQVNEVKGQLAGKSGEARNVAASLARFEQVAVKQKMAETLYRFAEGGLDQARRTAEAQSVYLTVFVPPGLPEEYTYPRRIQFSLTITLAFLVLWSVAALIWASIQDHRLS